MPRLNRRLTEKEIQNAKPKEKPYRLYDSEGLTILVRSKGAKVWQYRYRLHGKENVYTIGEVGKVSTAEAREERDKASKLVSKGIDPNAVKKEAVQTARWEAENSFQQIANDWYSKQSWAPKHGKNILSRLEKDVFSVIGKKPIKEVSIRDILDILRRIESRGALDVAKRINQYCVAIFDYAIAQDLCDSNPALGRSKFVKTYEVQHRPHLSEKELPDFLKRLEGYKNTKMRLAVKLLALTFVRPGELRGARWDEIDEENALWSIPAARMKMKRDHLVPLSAQSLEVIRQLRAVTGKSAFLFPGQRIVKPVSDVALIKVVKDISAKKARPHGFRHTASTILNEKGYNPDHIEAQLAHVEENKVRGTYNKAQYLDARRKMMQEWADYLTERAKEK